MTVINTLLLDLDDTLHDASSRVMPYLNQRMGAYIAQALHLPLEEGNHLGRHYFEAYGATAKGLIQHHPEIDITHFLETTHDITAVLHNISPMPSAMHLLQVKIPTYIISNGPRAYVKTVLQAAHFLPLCEDAFGLEDMLFHPKPHPEAFLNILSRIGKQPGECWLVDDVAVNVASARELGIHAIWFNPEQKKHNIDIPEIQALHELLPLFDNADRL